VEIFDLKNNFEAELLFEGDIVDHQDYYHLYLKYYWKDSDTRASEDGYITHGEAKSMIEGAKRLIFALERGLPVGVV